MQKRAITLGAALMLVIGIASGCSDQGPALQQLNQNEFTLRGMIATDEQRIDSLQQQIRRLGDEIAEIKHSGTGGANAEQTNALNDRIAKLESQVNALQAAVPTIPPAPPVGTETAPAAPPAVAALPGAPEVPSAPAAPSASAAAQPNWPTDLQQQLAATATTKEPGVKTYRQGLQAMNSGDYAGAVARFETVQHKYPKSPLVEPAEYFGANALYESGKYDRAILELNDLVMRFPKGKYTSQALLREAQAFVKLDDRIDARLTLQKLIADHAGTPEATAANTMMKSLQTD